MSNPNAVAAGGFTGPAVLIVWLAGRYGIDMPAEVAVVVGGSVIAAGLLIGRRGIVGVARIVWRGNPPQA